MDVSGRPLLKDDKEKIFRLQKERDKLYRFSRSIGLPTCLADIHARPEDLPAVTEKALAGIDVRVWPYPVTQQMLIDAVMELEKAQ